MVWKELLVATAAGLTYFLGAPDVEAKTENTKKTQQGEASGKEPPKPPKKTKRKKQKPLAKLVGGCEFRVGNNETGTDCKFIFQIGGVSYFARYRVGVAHHESKPDEDGNTNPPGTINQSLVTSLGYGWATSIGYVQIAAGSTLFPGKVPTANLDLLYVNKFGSGDDTFNLSLLLEGSVPMNLDEGFLPQFNVIANMVYNHQFSDDWSVQVGTEILSFKDFMNTGHYMEFRTSILACYRSVCAGFGLDANLVADEQGQYSGGVKNLGAKVTVSN